MTKRITISACILFIMLGFIAGGVSKSYETKETKLDESAQESSAVAYTEEDDTRYLLRVEDGVVVVFSENDITRPILVTDIYAGSLRNFDREQLMEGIIAESEIELQRLLEDFSS